MDDLVGKVVKLRSVEEGTYLVACDDGESVEHIGVDGDIAKQERAQWKVKGSKYSNQALRFVSMYGKYLAWQNNKIIQWEGKGYSATIIKWKLEETDDRFPKVYVKIYRKNDDHHFYLYSSPDTSVISVPLSSQFRWRLCKERCKWRIEEVRHPVTAKQQVTSKQQETRIVINQIGQYNDYGNEKKAQGRVGNQFSNYNSGGNANGSGKQIVGGVTVKTKISEQKAVFVNKIPM